MAKITAIIDIGSNSARMAIFAKADILNLCDNDALIPLIPKQKILLSKVLETDTKLLEALDARILALS